PRDPSPRVPPAPPAAGLGVDQLASRGRTIAFNDFQAGGTSSAYGDPKDRNGELVLDDPRDNPPTTGGGGGGGGTTDPGDVFDGLSDGACAKTKLGTSGNDH